MSKQTYACKRRFKRLELQGGKNTFIVQCKLLVRNSPKKSTKIGKGWKDFCKFNRLKEGDIIVFEVDNQMRKKIKVYPEYMLILLLLISRSHIYNYYSTYVLAPKGIIAQMYILKCSIAQMIKSFCKSFNY
ncbi:hypothetical protein DEO72_LG7g1568 [Vigna unguiculata]|uniref:TF-B3 domain-containing protein n=1 Tax=Vigna unguiculata TaxID=3917 RepID=A0A4D6MJA6_VIGUN|nr:hypothetical protein DEO72_LG7g1568 [Vigna unguiculata]